jgi:asparagine synthase (glutamine-hydrolysing)
MLGGYVLHYALEPVISSHPALQDIRSSWHRLRGQVLGKPASGRDPEWRALLDASFAHRVGLEEHYRAWQRAQPAAALSEREMHYRILTAGLQSHALEVLDRAAAACSIDLRHPFCDHRLVEWCLALPPAQKLQGGWSRVVMRRAMADFVPRDVRWRVDKTDFFPYFAHGLLVFERDRLDEAVLKAPELLTKYVDVSALQNMYRHAVRRPFQAKRSQVLAICRAISLALWLHNNEGR